METFSVLLAICAGNSPVPGELPAQGPVTRSFDVFFDVICVWINDWVNNREAGGSRRYRAHYDVIVMLSKDSIRYKIKCFVHTHYCKDMKQKAIYWFRFK